MNQIKTNIKAKNIDLDPSMRDHIDEKISGLQKLIRSKSDHEIVADVELEKPFGQHHKKGDVFRAEINLNLEGNLYRAESTEFDIKVAFDETVKEISRQLRRSKERQGDIFRRGGKQLKRLLRWGK